MTSRSRSDTLPIARPRSPKLKLEKPEPTNVTEFRHALEYACAIGDLDLATSLAGLWRANSSEASPGRSLPLADSTSTSEPVCIAAPTSEDYTWALEAAAQHGKPATISWLLSHGATVKRTTARCAVQGASTEVLDLLHESGQFDPNARDERGSPLLRHVVHNPDLIRWFLAHGTDVNLADSRGKGGTALSTAIFTGANRECIMLLVDEGKADLQRGGLLHAAAGRGEVCMLQWLVEGKGISVNQRQNEENTSDGHAVNGDATDDSARVRKGSGTPLHNAAQRGKLEAVKYLLGQGADPTIEDEEEDTPAELARFKGHNEVAEVLESVAP
ncbi:MAG: hypothetical protein M1831_004724 [Alyxoria varia]|nr:MAG: hypothetical protein M1831_004724 [Alyxoria varia]